MSTGKKVNDEKDHDCYKNRVCTRAGMFVSYFKCKVCGKNMRFSDSVD